MTTKIGYFLTSSLLALSASCASSAPKSSLHIQSYVASEGGLLASSYLIHDSEQAILVDAQLLISEAEKLADVIDEANLELKTIYVSHGHPDHHLGSKVLLKRFPNAKFVASSGTIAEIEATAQDKIDYWQGVLGDDVPSVFTVPEIVSDSNLQIGGEQLQLINIGAGESSNDTALYVPSLRAIAMGDMSYNNVHLWLTEKRPSEWHQNLKEIRETYDIDIVLAGHGGRGGAEIIDSNIKYIEDFQSALRLADKDAVVEEMTELYPEHRLGLILDIAAQANL